MNCLLLITCLLCIHISGLFAIWKGEEVSVPIPYQVAIIKSGKYNCGGSILSSRVILTAAYCVSNSAAKDLIIKTSLNGEISKYAYGIEKIMIHHNYDETNRLYDVALLRLAYKLNFDSNISSIPLIDRKENVLQDTILAVAGWGRNENGTTGAILKYATVKVMYNAYCYNRYFKEGKTFEKQSLFCAQGLNGENTCHHDAGSPIVGFIKGQVKLIGVTSLDSACGTKEPGYYTKISTPEIWNWIDKILERERNEIDFY